MPVTRIKVTFKRVFVLDSGDLIGAGEWYLTAKVDGRAVGNASQEFEARGNQWINLDEAAWSVEMDLLGREETQPIEIEFKVRDADVLWDDDLGEARMTLRYPFRTTHDGPITGSMVSGGLFFSDRRYFRVHVKVEILETLATTTPDRSTGVLVSRQNDGSSTFTTVSGTAIDPRVEVCPVIPVPIAPTALPPRPAFSAEVQPGSETIYAYAPELATDLPLNELVNPALIPVLSATDPDLNNKAARIAVTWSWPGDLELDQLTWHVKEGPIAIIGSNEGQLISVRGTTAATDTMGVLECRWQGQSGPLLATFRAWVGPIKEVKYRQNIVMNLDPVAQPLRTPVLTAQQVHDHMTMANLIWWQAGIHFIPDTNTTTWDGAVAAGQDGVYTVTGQRDSWTVNVDINGSPHATRLNFNPGVFNIAYVRSTQQGVAAATDIRGTSGTNEQLTGTPSTSWVLPTGVAPDGAAGNVTMRTFSQFPRSNSADAGYARARHRLDATFQTTDMRRIMGVTYHSVWNGTDAQHAQNLAHELGHVLCLRHRGSGGHLGVDRGVLSDDRVNGADANGRRRGHPWLENVMGYDNDNGLDVDLVQTAAVRKHPSAVSRP